MQSDGYQRATKRHAAIIDHTDGDQSVGFIHVPVGVSLMDQLSQGQVFLMFETESGESALLAMDAIKRIFPKRVEHSDEDTADADYQQTERERRQSTTNADPRESAQEARRTAEKERQKREEYRVKAAKARAEFAKQEEQAAEAKKANTSPFSDDLVQLQPEILLYLRQLSLPRHASWQEIQSTYRKLVKENHPDRLRGCGANEKDIEYAAARLLDINDAYRALSEFNVAA